MPKRHDQNPKDPEWRYPFQSREQIENLRVYFSKFATRKEGWHMQKGYWETHVLGRTNTRKVVIPFESVPPHLRARAEEWFNRKIAELKAKGINPSPGKIRSLRMNACNYGRNVLTLRRNANRVNYEIKKRKWLRYLDWKAAQERKEFLAARGPNPSKVLEIA